MKFKNHPFGSEAEAVILSMLLVVLLWIFHLFACLNGSEVYRLGVVPLLYSRWFTIFSMPFIHDITSYGHIVSNSVASLFLFAAIVFYYRFAALTVVLVALLFPPIAILFLANGTTPHVGFSGAVYTFFGFIALSGFLRNFRPLQVLSLLIVFLYGSLVWGIFPSKTHVSWEGHFSGFFAGICLAFFYRKKGPRSPKYRYEIEKEMGIDPPDFEGIWLAQKEQEKERLEQEQLEKKLNIHWVQSHFPPVDIKYYTQTLKEIKPPDGTHSLPEQDLGK